MGRLKYDDIERNFKATVKFMEILEWRQCLSQLTFTCSKSAKEKLEKGVKYV